MKTIERYGAQGDMILRRVDAGAIPAGFTEAKGVKGRHVLAHSETGHNHDADAAGLTLLTGEDPMVCYLRMDAVEHADVVHHRAHDTHETLRLLGEPGAVWEIRRQREYTPEGWRRVED